MSKTTIRKNKHAGSDFDDWLKEEGIFEEVCAGALKKVIAAEIASAIKEQHMTVSSFAREMGTSRTAVNRLLDEKNLALSVRTLSKAASVLGKKIKFQLVEAA